MNAIILYDEFRFALEAKMTLERATQGAGEGSSQSITLWHFDSLTDPAKAAAALREAADAQVVTLAIRRQGDLPPAVFAWLEQWAHTRQVRSAMLAVFLAGSKDRFPVTTDFRLSQFTLRHGLSLIFGDESATHSVSAEPAPKLVPPRQKATDDFLFAPIRPSNPSDRNYPSP